ncbi:hypothetical protein DJ64_16560 [Streptomyces griseorubens]|uniref:Uncharacterized protein n=1 Tax=Streptomyces griseorubens TaxID=66897 RepID=A0ABR4SWP6_9ACTN|nr:hypothetical protein DJ64_16560 [Streptomyces griseorubens]
MTRAQAARASWSANSETPPHPWTRTVTPGPTPSSAEYAVTVAQGRVAAVEMLGLGHQPLFVDGDVFGQPPVEVGVVVLAGCALGVPPNQRGLKEFTTRSPALNRVAPGPVASMTPAASDSGTRSAGTG